MDQSFSSNTAWVRLQLNNLKVLVPYEDVTSIDSTSKILQDNSDSKETGWLQYQGKAIPIFCLSAELLLLNTIPEDYQYVAIFRNGNELFGVACESARPIEIETSLQIQSIPECMQSDISPLAALVNRQEEFNYISGTNKLKNYISSCHKQIN